jgi:lactate permease
MDALIAVAPVVAVVLLIASGRVGVLPAGLIGWSLAAATAAALLPPPHSVPGFIALESVRGAWVAFQAVAVIVAGMFFYQVLRRQEAALFDAGTKAPFSHGRLWSVCFLLGPFAESATGFGVGAIIALAALLRMGLSGTPAAVLALYSQTLVPWGALAIGTLISAKLAHIPEGDLALASAWLSAPLLAGYLVFYWRLAAAAGHPVQRRQRRDDMLWTGLLAAALVAASAVLAPEIDVIAAAGGLLLLRWLRDERPDAAALRRTAIVSAPYAALTVALITTRTVPPLGEALRSILVLAPFPDLASFPILYNPSFWLVAVAAGFTCAAGRARELPQLVTETLVGAWRPAAVTVAFVVMAQLLAAAGGAQLICDALRSVLGNAALLATPAMGSGAGFLTGSITAATGMMMPALVALGTGVPLWPVALQNVAAANFTLFSPVRVSKVVALAQLPGGDAEIYRAAWPIGAMLFGLLIVEAAVLLALG